MDIKIKCSTDIKRIRNILSDYDEYMYFNNEEVENLILNYHPDKKIKSINKLVMKCNKSYKTKCLHVLEKNSSLEKSVGIKEIIENYYGIYDPKLKLEYNIKAGFRTPLYYGDKQSYYLNNTFKSEEDNTRIGKCVNCDYKGKISIDHYPISFKKILNDFLEEEKLNLLDLKIKYENGKWNLENKELEELWLYYHDSVASYRTLCKKCNSSFNCYSQ